MQVYDELEKFVVRMINRLGVFLILLIDKHHEMAKNGKGYSYFACRNFSTESNGVS